MKKEMSFSLVILLVFILSLGLIKFCYNENFKTNVKNKVFEECLNYYSSQGVGVDSGIINVCVSKADYALDKK